LNFLLVSIFFFQSLSNFLLTAEQAEVAEDSFSSFSDISVASFSLTIAESLFVHKDYFNAASEYERYLFINSENISGDSLQKIKFKLAISYLNSGETDKAERVLQELTSQNNHLAREAQIQFAKVYLQKGDLFKAKIELNDILLFTPEQSDTMRKEVYRLLGIIALQERETKDALNYFTLAQDSFLIAKTRILQKTTKKNILLSQIFSSIIPGAGEIYCGKYGWGILSLLVNSASIYGTVYSYQKKQYLDASLIFSLLFTRFYNGSRNNARDFAQEYNDKIYNQHILEIEKYKGCNKF